MAKIESLVPVSAVGFRTNNRTARKCGASAARARRSAYSPELLEKVSIQVEQRCSFPYHR
jgi:hypothetical protein